MGLFFFQESVRGPGFLSLFLTIILMCINIIYVLVAMRWYLILKLIDLDEKASQLRREGLEQENKCEGFVPKDALPKDYWVYDEEKIGFEGMQSGRIIALGDEVTIKVVSADLAKRQLEFKILVN